MVLLNGLFSCCGAFHLACLSCRKVLVMSTICGLGRGTVVRAVGCVRGKALRLIEKTVRRLAIVFQPCLDLILNGNQYTRRF